MKSNKRLIIGDLHVSEKRTKAITLATNSIFSVIEANTIFDEVVLLGDIFNKYPTMFERLFFANFLKRLYKFTSKVVIIRGTELHDFSKGIFNLEDLIVLSNGLSAVDRYKVGKFLFVHEAIKGAKYDNGVEEKEGLDISTVKEKIIAGHYHTGSNIKNLCIVGSIYKTNFSQKDDAKRILLTNNTKVKSFAIESRPMLEVNLTGDKGKVVCKEMARLKSEPKGSELDLKVIATTDSQTLPSIHSSIAKIKDKFKIEYYQENIEIVRLKSNVPKNLNENELLKEYAKENYDLAKKELN